MFFSEYGKTIRDAICTLIGMEASEDIGKNLGVPILSKRATKETFESLITRVRDRLSWWKADQLSFARRQVLVQSVSAAIANHVMQTTRLPYSFCEELDRINRNFLWGRSNECQRVPLVKWEIVYMPKDWIGEA